MGREGRTPGGLAVPAGRFTGLLGTPAFTPGEVCLEWQRDWQGVGVDLKIHGVRLWMPYSEIVSLGFIVGNQDSSVGLWAVSWELL